MNLPDNPIPALERMIENNLQSLAEQKIKEWGLKIKIVDGRLVDLSDSTEAWLKRFITKNEALNEVKKDIAKLANVQDEVLIYGETGTGKEILAHALHGEREGKFLAINCAGLPENLIESELFGHTKGAFTGADSPKVGLMKAASAGTLFLDEVGELPIQVQAKFLRAIQEKHIRAVGSTKVEEIDCRIICATNRDLWADCNDNRFRLDLYARISTIEVDIDPLLKRPEDIVPIIESMHKGQEFLDALDKVGIRPTDLDLTLNVRSLQQHVRRFVVLGKLPKTEQSNIRKELGIG